jgi:hypothetical protein
LAAQLLPSSAERSIHLAASVTPDGVGDFELQTRSFASLRSGLYSGAPAAL